MQALLALEPDADVDLTPPAGEGLVPRLARARQAEAASREALEAAMGAWLAVETSDWLASAALVRMAEDAKLDDRGRARWIARRAASRIARLATSEPEGPSEALVALTRRAVELAEGELPAELVGELLPLLAGRHADPATLPREDASAALALALEATGRPEHAAHLWRELRASEDAETVALVAARDARGGELLAALEGWDRAAELAARLGRAADARRAWVRAADLALALSLEEAASERLERALDTLHAITADDAGALVSTVRRAGLVELAGRVEQLVIVAITADGGESPALLGALEELLAWAVERGAATRARALHATLARVRPERAALEPVPPDPVEPEEPRRRAERLRNEGRLGEAATVLATLGKADRDAATLRGALDLAERAGAWDTAREIIDTLLGWVGEGPVAESLRRRRERLGAS
jgi:tetratricopeptide (TPR) repeat protein